MKHGLNMIAGIKGWTGLNGRRKLGLEKGKIWMSDDFTDPLPQDILLNTP